MLHLSAMKIPLYLLHSLIENDTLEVEVVHISFVFYDLQKNDCQIIRLDFLVSMTAKNFGTLLRSKAEVVFSLVSAED